MRARWLTIALPLVVLAAPDLALAQRSHPGGRGGMRSMPSGGPASYRHPRAGTGSGAHGYYRPYHGSHRGPYSGYGYRPYYRPYQGGSYYRPWYGPYVYGSVYGGWPYGYGAWPYAYAPYAYGPGERTVVVYGAGAGAPAADEEAAPAASRGPSGELRLEVRPEDASVYVDDAFRGTAGAARILDLAPGRHTVEIVRPGYAVERREVRILEGERADLFVELRQH